MLNTNSRERLALGVVALLLTAGAGSRLFSPDPPPLVWEQEAPAQQNAASPTDTLAERVPAALRAEVQRQIVTERVRSTPLLPGEKLDVNRVSTAELERLPRVGPALAARIAAHRQAKGDFATLADLDAVPGIGPALLAAIQPFVALPAAPEGSVQSAPPKPRARRAAKQALSPPPDTLLDLNRATLQELEALPGIGPALARRVLDWRDDRGPFRTVHELELVAGIGPALMGRLERRLYVAIP